MSVSNESNEMKPPQNLEVERGILGGMLLDPRKVADVVDALGESGECFSHLVNREIYKRIVALWKSFGKVDLAILGADLDRIGRYKAVGGAPYLAHLEEEIVSTIYLPEYCRIALAHYTRRRAIARLETASNGELHNAEDPAETISSIAADLQTLTDDGRRGGWVHVGVLARELIERLKAGPSPHDCIPTGFSELDSAMDGGLRSGEFCVIAGGTSSGKSALMCQFVVEAALRRGKKVLIFSLEMGRDEYMLRIKSQISGIALSRIRKRHLNPNEIAEMESQLEILDAAQLVIDDGSSNTIAQVQNRAKAWALRHGSPHLIVIDYLQRLLSHDHRATEESETHRKAHGMKTLARELCCSVVTGSQINEKEAKIRKDKHPVLADMKYANSISEEADLLIGVYRQDRTSDCGELAILKQRNGPVLDWFRIGFDRATASFLDAQG